MQNPTGNSGIPTPQHLSTKLAILSDNPYLIEDIWIHTVSDAPPLQLTDAPVQNGICGMLKIDWCKEEQKRLGMETDGMCAWFSHELAAVTIVLYSPDSKQDPSYLILTDN